MTSKLINITDKNIEPKFETPANKTLSYLNDSIQLNKDNNELNISNQIRINGCGFLKNNKKQIMDPGHILFPNGIYETDNTFVFTVNSDIGGLVFNDLIIGNQNYKVEDQVKLWIDNTDNMIGKQYVVFAEANEKVTKITETYIADNGFAVPKEVIKREWEFTFEHKLINNNLNNILNYVYGSWDISQQFQLVKNKVNKYGCLWTLSDSAIEMFNNQAMDDGTATLRNTYKICLGVFEFNKNEGDGNYNIKNKSIIGDGFIFDGFQNNTFIGADKFSLISNDDLDTIGTYKIKEIDYGSIKESTLKVNQETLSEGIKILGNNKPHLYLKTKQDDFQYAYWTSSMEPQSFFIKDFWSPGNQLETYTDILNNIANATISDDDGGAYGYYILSAARLADIDNEHGIIFEEGDIILYNIPTTAYIQCVGYLRNDEKGGSFYPLYNENIQSIYNIVDLINEAYPEWKSTLQNFYINFTTIDDTFYFKSPSFYFLGLDNKEIKTEELYNNQLIIEDILSNFNFKYNTLTNEMGGHIKDKYDNIVGNINSSKFTGSRINNCIVLWDDKIWGNDNFKDFGRLICFFNDNIIKYDSEEVEYTTIKEKEKIESKQFVGELIKTSHSNITDDGIISGVKYNLLSKKSLGGLQYDEVPTYTIGSKTKYEITLGYNIYSDTDIKVKYIDQSYNDIDFIFNKTIRISNNKVLKYNDQYGLKIFMLIKGFDVELYKENSFIENFYMIDIEYNHIIDYIDEGNILNKDNFTDYVPYNLVGNESWNETINDTTTPIGCVRLALYTNYQSNILTIGNNVQGSRLKQVYIDIDMSDSNLSYTLLSDENTKVYTGTWKILTFFKMRQIGSPPSVDSRGIGLFMRIV